MKASAIQPEPTDHPARVTQLTPAITVRHLPTATPDPAALARCYAVLLKLEVPA